MARYDPSSAITRTKDGFFKQGTALRGVVPTVKALFFPEYTYQSAVMGTVRRAPKNVPRIGNETKGFERGTSVDRQITHVIKLLARHDLPASALSRVGLSKEVQSQVASPSDLVNLELLSRTMHPFTREFLKVMAEKRWHPVGAQVLVGSSQARLGTAVDVVVAPFKGSPQRILIEIKSGYFSYLNKYSLSLHAPFQNYSNSPYHQFQLQLLTTTLLFERQNRKKVSAFVVVLHEFGHDVFPLQEEWRALAKPLWQELVRTAAQNRAVRREITRVARDVAFGKRKRAEEHKAPPKKLKPVPQPLPPTHKPFALPGELASFYQKVTQQTSSQFCWRKCLGLA